MSAGLGVLLNGLSEQIRECLEHAVAIGHPEIALFGATRRVTGRLSCTFSRTLSTTSYSAF